MEVTGVSALVTGAASGLGAATAGVLAAAGARVALLDRDEDRVVAQAHALGREALGLACDVTDEALGLACDVTDEASVEAALAAVAAAHGPARLVVNCAGIVSIGRLVGREGPLDMAGFRRTIEVNLIGTATMMSRAAHHMAGLAPLGPDGERGLIVNTASIAAFEGQIGQAAYAASKGGVAALTLPAAREFVRLGIRVMAIAPGVFETPMVSDGLPEEVRQALIAKCQFPPRLGRPEEFGRLVLALAENPMLNGEIIRLDGAQRLEPR
ncbi:SDR family NAD(P)-dependent oxidoreductase [Pararhodospirillum photometricum]|uniref:Dehydrogenase with different specificities n=1 Tax=Pararhodospirillum photometricum DSM 122 TaxID=1150469 RepID=H6SLI1_PARPM|nr:SDR family NAD(P)-dependent oxidoreductase [Pararhodospirillum photometricum]CCG08846.1 Dehydrogenase with different specificities [Pararhodospirillum photometricum DSM 122]